MAHKIFNKFKAPKYTEFSRKDLVVDIKSGELFFKSNLGVHKVSTTLETDVFGGDDIGIQTSSFDNLSVPGFIIGGGITSSGTISASGAIFAGLPYQVTPQVIYYNTQSGKFTYGDVSSFSGGGGSVNSVTSGDTNTITIGGTSTDPTISANTAAVTNGSLNLVTGNDVFDFIQTQGFATDTFKASGQRDGNSGISGSFSVSGSITSSGNISATGSLSVSGSITSSGDISSSGTGSFEYGFISNNLTVEGTVNAQEFHTEFVSSSIIFESGSTIFGDTADDTHSFSGSVGINATDDPAEALEVVGNISSSGWLKVISNIQADQYIASLSHIFAGGIMSASSYIIGDSIRSSNFVSASGLLYASSSIGNFTSIVVQDTASGQLHTTSSEGLSSQLDTFKVTGQRDGDSGITGSLLITGEGHVTASGNISASGYITTGNYLSSSGLLYASSSEGNYTNIVVQDTSSGLLYTTSSAALTIDTASWAINAITSSYVNTAETASYVNTAETASFIATASWAYNAVTSSFIATASWAYNAVTSSFIATSSWAYNAVTSSYVNTAETASHAEQAVTASFIATSSWAYNAVTSSYVNTAETASHAEQAVTASFIATASWAYNAVTSSYIATASWANNALTASYVDSTTLDTFKGTGIRDGDGYINGNLTASGNIEAGGNISSSGMIYASQSIFGTGAGSSKDFDFYGNAHFHNETFLQNFDSLSGNSRFRDDLRLYFGDDRQYGIKYSSVTDKFNIVSGSSNDLITIDKQGSISASGLLFASSSEGNFPSIVVQDTASGLFYTTSSQGFSQNLDTFKATGQRDGNSEITGSLTITGNISASGGISASELYVDNNIVFNHDPVVADAGVYWSDDVGTEAYIRRNDIYDTVEIGSDSTVSFTETDADNKKVIFNLNTNQYDFEGEITASGNISASGLLYASSSVGNYTDIVVQDTASGLFYTTSSQGFSQNLDTFKETGQRDGDSGITGSLVIGEETSSYDFKVFGASLGAFMQWDASEDGLTIKSPADEVGLSVLTTASSQPTVDAQLKVGRNLTEWVGLKTRDRDGYFIHRQDETDHGQARTHFAIWDSSHPESGSHNWRWTSNDGTGSNNQIRMLLTSSGRLGINQANPQTELEVVGSISASGLLYASSSEGNFTNIVVQDTASGLFYTTASSNISTTLDTFKQTGIRTGDGYIDGNFTASGNISASKTGSFAIVGIGTDSPQKSLDIAGGDIRLDNSKGIFFATTDANIGRVGITGDESGDFIQLKVDNSNSHLLRLNTTGLGIGTTTPGEKLEVVGNISASGLVKATWFDAQTVATGYRLGGSNILYFKDNYYTFGRQNADVLVSGSTISLGKPGETDIHVSASGNISASGLLFASSSEGNFPSIVVQDTSSGQFYTTSSQGLADTISAELDTFKETGQRDGDSGITGSLSVTGEITGSDQLLIVKSSGEGTPTIGTSNVAIFQNNDSNQDASISIIAADSHKSQLHFGKHDDIDAGGIRYFHEDHASYPDQLKFRAGGQNIMTLKEDTNKGYLGIGGDHHHPSQHITVQGSLGGDGMILSSSSGVGFTMDRNATTNKTQFLFNTARVTKWILGNLGESDDNFYIYNGTSTNDKIVAIDHTTGGITASGDITASGLLFASSSNVDHMRHIVIYDTSSGEFQTIPNPGLVSGSSIAQVTVTAANTQNATHYLTFANTQTGPVDLMTDNGLLYNPSHDGLTLGIITASGDISSSGTGSFNNIIVDKNITVNSISASADISASGTGSFNNIVVDKNINTNNISASAGVSASFLNVTGQATVESLYGAGGLLLIGSDYTDEVLQIQSATAEISSQITASGNITASGLLFASSSEGNYTNIVVQDTASGLFYTTSSAALSITNAITASYVNTAETASYVNTAETASYVNTAETASYVNTAETASFIATASWAYNAVTSSYINTAETASYVNTAETASFIATSSWAYNAVTSSYVNTAETASYTNTAETASFVTTAQSASFIATSSATVGKLFPSASSGYKGGLKIVDNNGALPAVVGSLGFDGSSDMHIKMNVVGLEIGNMDVTQGEPVFAFANTVGNTETFGVDVITFIGSLAGNGITFDNTTNKLNVGDGMISSSAQIADDISGSWISLGLLSSSAQIASDISGAFTADLLDDLGLGLLSSSAQIADDISGSWISLGLLSSSAQIADEISGSFLLNTTDTLTGDLEVTNHVTVSGDLDVDGLTNLDAVDIDGNVQLDGTLDVGVNGTGYDVTFYGDTSTRYMVWDADTNNLGFKDNTTLTFGDGTDMKFYHDGTDNHIDITSRLNIAGGALSASGHLFASASEKAGQTYKSLVMDTSTGRIYYTGSYGDTAPPGVGGDNLGDHTATQDLNLDSNNITNVTSASFDHIEVSGSAIIRSVGAANPGDATLKIIGGGHANDDATLSLRQNLASAGYALKYDGGVDDFQIIGNNEADIHLSINSSDGRVHVPGILSGSDKLFAELVYGVTTDMVFWNSTTGELTKADIANIGNGLLSQSMGVFSSSAQFADEISGSFLLNTTDTLTGDLEVTNHITASGNIIAKGATSTIQNVDTTNNYIVELIGGGGPKINFGDTDVANDDFMTIGAYQSRNNIDSKDRDFHIFSSNNNFSLKQYEGLTLDVSTMKIGIGTLTPGEKLDVHGNVHASGSISASGHLFASASENAGQTYKTLVMDTSTGKIYHTGSYGDTNPPGAGGDNLGNHTASKALDMAGYDINFADEINVAEGNGKKGVYYDSYNYLSPQSHNDDVWIRSDSGRFTFQTYNDSDNWTYSYQLHLPDPATAGDWGKLAEIGNRTTNSSAKSRYRGLRIVKYNGSSVVDGELVVNTITASGAISASSGHFDGATTIYQPSDVNKPTLTLDRTTGDPSIKAAVASDGHMIIDSDGSKTLINHYVSDHVGLASGGGSVIIGANATPGEKLEVRGGISASGTGSFKSIILPGGSVDGRIIWGTVGTSEQFIYGKDHSMTIDGDNYVNIYSDVYTKIASGHLWISSGNVTASNDISASGLLYASASVNPGQTYGVLVRDSSTGRIYETGSYVGAGDFMNEVEFDLSTTGNGAVAGDTTVDDASPVKAAFEIIAGDGIKITGNDSNKSLTFETIPTSSVIADSGSFNTLRVTSTGDTAAPPQDGHLFNVTTFSNNNPTIEHFFVENDSHNYGMRWVYDGATNNDFRLYRHNNSGPGTEVVRFHRLNDNVIFKGSTYVDQDVSASGHLYSSASVNPGQTYGVLVRDPDTGRIYETGSYVGGGGDFMNEVEFDLLGTVDGHVAGDTTVDDASPTKAAFELQAGGGIMITGDDSNKRIKFQTSHTGSFNTVSASRMHAVEEMDVDGILDVEGTFDFASTGTFNDDITVVANKKIIFNTTETYITTNNTNPEDLQIYADEDIVLMPDGQVGIGDTNPQSKLHIEITDTTTNAITNTYADYALALRNNTDTLNAFAGIAFDVSSETDADSIGAAIKGVCANSTSTNHDTHLTFHTNDISDDDLAERMRITNAGDVGIGTTTPGEKLDVNGTIQGTAIKSSAGTGYLLSDGTVTNSPVVSVAAGTNISVTGTSNNPPGGTNATVNFSPGGNVAGVYFNNQTTSTMATPLSTFTYNSSGGGVLRVGNDIIAFASDKRLKENIVEIPDPIEKIKQLRGVYYDWKDEALKLGFQTDRQHNEVGLIAQELEKVLPQAVKRAPFDNIYNEKIYVSPSGSRTDGETEPYKTIKMDKVVPLLIEGIKDQQKQIDELKELVNKLINK